jgi:surface protein
VAHDSTLKRVTVANDDGDVYVESTGDDSEVVLKTQKVRVDGDVYCGASSSVGLSSRVDAVETTHVALESRVNALDVTCSHPGGTLSLVNGKMACACASGWLGASCQFRLDAIRLSSVLLSPVSITSKLRLAVRTCLQKSSTGACACTHASPCGFITDGSSIGDWNVAQVTDMSYMFYNAFNFNQNVQNWNVSQVTDMSYMFYNAQSFNQNVQNWNVVQVTDMSYMFYNAFNFNQNVQNWNVAQVTDMSYMFYGTYNFNHDIRNLTFASGARATNMFGTSRFLFRYVCANEYDGPPSACRVRSFTTDYALVQAVASCFSESADGNCQCVNKCGEVSGHISTWNTTGIMYMQDLFRDRRFFNQRISNWDTSSVRRMDGMFRGAQAFNQNVVTWNVSNVEDMSNMFNGAASFVKDLSAWQTRDDVAASNMFSGASKFTILYDCGGLGVDGPPASCADRSMPNSLVHRFDFSNDTCVQTAANSNVVTAVVDLQGASAVTVSGSPVRAQSIQNGLSVLNFTVDGAFLQFESTALTTQEPEVYVVLSASSSTEGADSIGTLFSHTSYDGSYALRQTSENRLTLAEGSSVLASAFALEAKWYVANFLVETDGGNDGFLRLSARSTELGAFTSTLTPTYAANAHMTIGGAQASSSFVPNSIGEVLIFNEKLDDLDRAFVDAYLQEKWNTASGSMWMFDAKLVASDGGNGDQFGLAVAVSGGVVVVGSPYDDTHTNDAGSAYVFMSSSGGNWTQVQKLTAPLASGEYGWNHYNARFGSAVGVSGDTIIVGKPYFDSMYGATGAVYVYKRSSAGGTIWTHESTLTPSDGQYQQDYFGDAVAISGDVVVVGARFDDDYGSNSGSAYVFERAAASNWTQVSKLIPDTYISNAYFGQAVAVHGDVVVVGAPNVNNYKGVVYVYGRSDGAGSSWTQVAKLEPSDGQIYDNFGAAVAVYDGVIVVGSPRDDGSSSGSYYYDAGSAYVYERSGSSYNWTLASKLEPPSTSSNPSYKQFGASVSVSGDFIVVGPKDDMMMSYGYQERVYVFVRSSDGWYEHQNITAADGSSYDLFGASAALSEENLVIGSRYDDDSGSSSGSAYAFSLV